MNIATHNPPGASYDPAHLRFPIRSLMLALLFTLVMFGLIGWSLYSSSRFSEAVNERYLRLEELRGAITYFDEVLTTSAQLAATTANSGWEERYKQHAPKIDQAIETALKLAFDQEVSKAIDQTSKANSKLVELEEQAFMLVRAGNASQARTILFSSEYEEHKMVYATGLANFNNHLRQYIRDATQAEQTRTLFSIGCAMVITILSGLAWLNVVKNLRRWHHQLLHASRVQVAFDEIETRHLMSSQVSQQALGMAANLNVIAHQQASGSQEQVAVVDQIKSSVRELSNTAGHIHQLTDKVNLFARQADQDSQQIAQITLLSASRSEQALAAIAQTSLVSSEMSQLSQQLLQLFDQLQAKNVNTRLIMSLLSEIAQETHLLSLNASLEAAGAGEYGTRFGVVAQEVKRLATRSSAASHEVISIVQEIEDAAQQAQQAARASFEKMAQMRQLVEEVGQIIAAIQAVTSEARQQANLISRAVSETKELTGVIMAATGQQHEASEQVLLALTSLGTVASQSAESSRLVTDAVCGLEELSQQLNLTLISN